MARSRPVVLRPAVAADAGFLVWALQEASGGLFRTLLGRRADAILAGVVAQPTHELSFEHAVIAESGGAAVGACQGMPHGTPSASRAVVAAAGIRSVRAAAVVAAGWRLFAAMERRSPGQWYLQAIAVRSPARDAGVGRLLIDHAFGRAAAAGCAAVALDVDAANVRARRLYERFGFRVVATSPRAPLLGGVHVHRLVAPLDQSSQLQ